jgi:predicted metal-dependent HD superfamily phosphohydrolase
MIDLRARFISLLDRMGASHDSGPLADALLSAWAEPSRAYHGRRHLEDCLDLLDGTAVDARTRDLVELALWFHDAVYDSRARDNEARSARWAVDALPSLGLDAATVDRIERLVLLTRDHAATDDETGRLVCDIDLAVLGRPPDQFDSYQHGIRAEYAWVPDEAYREGRARLLAELLRRESLFQTDSFRDRFGSTARANLRRALDGLAAKG